MANARRGSGEGLSTPVTPIDRNGRASIKRKSDNTVAQFNIHFQHQCIMRGCLGRLCLSQWQKYKRGSYQA